MDYFIDILPPTNFFPSVEVAGCFIECDNKILLLKRHSKTPQGGTWGIPAGKFEKGENATQALIREVYEETGLFINENQSLELGKFFVKLPHVDYIFHMFLVTLTYFPALQLASTEHDEAQWLTVFEALKLPLIKGGKECLEFYQKFKDKKEI